MTGLRRLDRWILARFLRAWVTFTAAALLAFLVIDLFANLKTLSALGLLTTAAVRYALMLPEVYFTLGPFLPLLAALWVIAQLQHQNELVPLLAAGESPGRLAWPLLLAGALLAPACYADRELLLPRLAPLHRARVAVGSSWKCPRPVPDGGSDGSGRTGLLAARFYSAETHELYDVRFTLLDERGDELRTALAALGSPAGEGWLLRDGLLIDRAPAPPGGESGDRITPIPPEGWLLATTIRVEDVEAAVDSPAYQSRQQIERQMQRTPGFRHLAVRVHERITQSLAGVVLLLVAVPLALRGSGGWDSLLRIAASLAIGFAYFITSTFAYQLGAKGALPPLWAAYGPLVAFAALGLAVSLGDLREGVGGGS